MKKDFWNDEVCKEHITRVLSTTCEDVKVIKVPNNYDWYVGSTLVLSERSELYKHIVDTLRVADEKTSIEFIYCNVMGILLADISKKQEKILRMINEFNTDIDAMIGKITRETLGNKEWCA